MMMIEFIDWWKSHGRIEAESGSFDAAEAAWDHQGSRIAELEAQLERERMRLAACGVVALANTQETATKARTMHDDYKSASCDDVARAVDREMALREQLKTAKRDAILEVVRACRIKMAYTINVTDLINYANSIGKE